MDLLNLDDTVYLPCTRPSGITGFAALADSQNQQLALLQQRQWFDSDPRLPTIPG